VSRRVVILANVGNRDVSHSSRSLDRPRTEGKELLERYREVSSEIDLPIILPALGFIEEEWREELEEPAYAGLFYTDQDPAISETHREKDTVYLAEIVRRKLLERFDPSRRDAALRFAGKKAIRLYRVEGNPARYDQMHAHFERFFREDRFLSEPEGWLCFVLTSGGTPAMSAMLMLHAIEHFGASCVQVYTDQGGRATDLRVGERLLRRQTARSFDEALESLRFGAAAEILQGSPLSGWRVHACRYAESRLSFDFRRARAHCREALKRAGPQGERLMEEELDGLEPLLARNPKKLLEELFYNMQVKHRSGEYVDFLGRAFRLAEGILTLLVEEDTGIRNDGKRSLADQLEAVEAVRGLRPKVEPVLDHRPLNRRILQAVAGHLATAEAGLPEVERERVSRVLGRLAGLDRLAELRNRTILAHGFEGVSREDVEERYGSAGVLEDIRGALEAALGYGVGQNPFERLAERLRL